MRTTKAFRESLAVLLILAAAAPAGGGDAADRHAAREAAVAAGRSLGMQTELPGATEGPSFPLPSGWVPEIPEWLASAMVWTAAGLFAAVLLLAVADKLRTGGRRRLPPGGAGKRSSPSAVRERMTAAREEADDLAARGDFAGAMHVLLLQSLDEMRRRLEAPIASSLTSREILRGARLEPPAATALADIVERVEISYFGPHKPGEGEYGACRRSFSTLTGVLRGEGTA